MRESLSPWSVAIFAAREAIDTLAECIDAAAAACRGQAAVIDVLVNGNRMLADAAGRYVAGLALPEGVLVQVWFIALGDKSHTWNEYVYSLWQGKGTVFFIDGYARVRPDAFGLIGQALAASRQALGASGVPSSGRTAKALRASLLASGGIHGNLYAIGAEGMDLLRHGKFRLPLGLYRTDPLIGAVLKFRCDPSAWEWDSTRILVHPEATWDVRQAGTWTVANFVGAFKRKLRQAQGELENRAAREHLAVNKCAIGAIPRTANEFVKQWVAQNPQASRALFLRHPLTYYAHRKLAVPRDWAMADQAPLLLASSPLELDGATGRVRSTAHLSA